MKKQISTKGIFAFCLGNFSKGILTGLITTFLLPFFIPTDASTQLIIYIPAAAIAMAVIRGIGTLWDAVTDPWVASLSDKCKHKDGRRIPFMKWACIPYALFALLVFFPPVNKESIVNVVWVGFMLVFYYTFSTIYNVPYLALQAELTTDSKRRVFLYTIDSLMYVVASALLYTIFAIKGALMKSGIEEVWALRIPFIVFAIIGLVTAAIPAFVTKEKEYVEQKDCYMPIMQSLKTTFKYKNFRVLTAGYLIMWVAFTIFNASQAYYIKNLIGQSDTFVTVVLAISIAVGVITYPLLNKLVRKTGKKKLIIGACIAYTIIYACIFFSPMIANAMGGMEVGGKIFGVLLGLSIAFPIAITNIIPASAFADLAQYDYILTGETKTGMFVAAKNFISKLSNSIVIAIVPSILMIGSTDGIATTFGIRMTAIIASAFVALSILLYVRYDDKEIANTIENWNKEQKALKESNNEV